MKRSLLKKVMAVGLTVVMLCGTALFGGCKNPVPKGDISVYMPDGAPALALAKLLQEDTETDGVSYRVVKSDLIAAQVTNKDETKNADLCVMPLTAAAKLLGSGERYTMLGAVTQGNLYLISENGGVLTEVSELRGKTVGVLQIDNVPGLVFKSILNKYNLEWSVTETENENAVRLEGILSASDVVKGGRFDYYVLAEPAVSVQVKKNGFSILADLQTLYGGENGYPQAVLVAKKTLVAEKTDWVRAFVQKVTESGARLTEMTGEEIVQAVKSHLADEGAGTSLNAGTLSAEALSRCGIRYSPSKECAVRANALLQDFIKIQPAVTVLPKSEFYWME